MLGLQIQVKLICAINCMLQLLDLRNLVLCPLLILVEVTGIIQQEDIDLL